MLYHNMITLCAVIGSSEVMKMFSQLKDIVELKIDGYCPPINSIQVSIKNTIIFT